MKLGKSFLLLRYLELRHGKMFLSAAILAALNVRVPGCDHVVIEIILEDAVRFFQYRLPVLLEDRHTGIVHSRFRRPLLAPADLGDDLLDGAAQGRVLAPL